MSTALTRRETLALGFLGAALAAAAARAGERPVLAVFDGRYSDSRRFAERAARAGAERFDARDDLARLWRRLDARPWRIVALTTPADLGLGVAGGRERGLSLQVSGLHDGRAGQGLEHRLEGPFEPEVWTRVSSGLIWPVGLAELMMAAPTTGEGFVRFRTARAADHPGTLASWSLA